MDFVALGSHGARWGGLRRAGLALRKPGPARASPGRPGIGPGTGPRSSRTRSRSPPDPVPPRPTASTSPNPRERTPGRRSRGLPDDLAGRVTISRPGRRPAGGPGQSRRRDYGPHRLRASADRMADQPDGEDGEAPTPGAWRRPSGRAWAESRRRSPSRCAQPVLARGAALHRCLRASRRLRGDRRGWLSTKRRTQTGAVRA